MLPYQEIRCLLLVRNGVDHDARVLRAARVAERALGGRALVVGAATAASPAGDATLEGIAVVRLPTRPPKIARLAEGMERYWRRRPGHVSDADARPSGSAAIATVAATRTQSPAATSHLTPAARARRIVSGLFYTLQAVMLARRARVELVHANDWNTMWAGLFIKYLIGAQLVYDSHELWADRNGRWEWRPWLLACEALFVRAADEVLTSSPGHTDALAARYRIPRPAVVRNIPETPPATPRNSPIAPRSRTAENLVVYVGGLMPARGLEQMIDALPLIPEIRLQVVGPGAPHYRAGLLARAEASGVLDRLELCQPVAPAEVGEVLAEATAGLCLFQPTCRSYELGLPNKLFEYAAAGVPVLASDLPVIAAIVRSEGLGEIAPAGDDPQAIAASLRRLLEPDGWTLAAQRARAFAATNGWAGEAHTLESLYGRVNGVK